VLALATLIALLSGGGGRPDHPESAAPRGAAGVPGIARDSLFRLGRDRLWQRLWQDELASHHLRSWSASMRQIGRPSVGSPPDPAATPVYRTGRVGKRAHLRVAV
jgi:hypothetical protein